MSAETLGVAVHNWDDKSQSEVHVTRVATEEFDSHVVLTDRAFGDQAHDMLSLVSKDQWEQLKAVVDAHFLTEEV